MEISFKKILACMVCMASFCIGADAENVAESAPGATRIGRNAMEESEERTVVIDEKKPIEEAVVTGTRDETDIRHLPFTVSVVGRSQIEQSHEVSLLPILSEQVPGLFVTQRAMMGYGVSEGLDARTQRRFRADDGPYRRSSPVYGAYGASDL